MTNNLSHSTQNRSGVLTFGLSFVFFAFIMTCAPYASDDLEFGSLPYTRFSEYLTYALEYGNGRLLGNLTAIALSSVRWLNVVVKALVLSSTVVLIPGVLGLSGKGYPLLSMLLVLTVDPVVFGETYVWTSGFSNYIPPIWLSLVILWVLRRYPETAGKGVKALLFTGVFLMGFAAQLFIEHSSGVNVLLALTAFVLCRKQKDRERTALSAVWLAAAVLGLAAMLLIPKIFYIPHNHTDSYRSAHLGSIAAMVISCARNVIQLSNHYYGACTLPLCFGALTTVWLTRERRRSRINRVLGWLAGASAIYVVLGLTLGLEIYLGKSAIIQHALSGFFAFLPFLVWAVAAWGLEGQLRQNMMLCLLFALVSLLPLLMVTPIPSRVIFQSWVFVLMGALLCLRELLKKLSEKQLARFFRGCAAAAVLCCVLLGSVFASIAAMAHIRDTHIRREIEAGATQIQVFSLPYRYTTWDHLWSLRFLYPSEQEIQFETMDFDNWMNDVYQ